MNLREVFLRFPGRLQLLQNAKNFWVYGGQEQCADWLTGRCSYLPFVIAKRHMHGTERLQANSYLSDPENKGQRQRGVNFDTIGSWNNRMEMPIQLEKSIEKGKLIPRIPLDRIGTASLVGRRKVNEDRFKVEELDSDLLYFGIFDGHGGELAVDYVNNHMLDHLRFWLSKSTDLFEVLRNSFLDVNNVLTRHIYHYDVDRKLYFFVQL